MRRKSSRGGDILLPRGQREESTSQYSPLRHILASKEESLDGDTATFRIKHSVDHPKKEKQKKSDGQHWETRTVLAWTYAEIVRPFL